MVSHLNTYIDPISTRIHYLQNFWEMSNFTKYGCFVMLTGTGLNQSNREAYVVVSNILVFHIRESGF